MHSMSNVILKDILSLFTKELNQTRQYRNLAYKNMIIKIW